jgi:hypothetical protein
LVRSIEPKKEAKVRAKDFKHYKRHSSLIKYGGGSTNSFENIADFCLEESDSAFKR